MAVQDSATAVGEAMDVDTSATNDRKGKRKADEEHLTETSEGKKPRLGKSSIAIISLKF
jgi:hypothetical protein